MDALTSAALVGTGQRPPADLASGTRVDVLAATLASSDTERALLLRAGTLAIYRLAGHSAEPLPDVPAPAPAETLAVCSHAAAELLRQLLSTRDAGLLTEALERGRDAQLRLPPALLPLALATRDADVRQALVPVLGERGRWLARQNSAWAWVAQTRDDTAGALHDDAEPLWQEGTAGQRVALLRRLRAVDPAKARDWLAAAWKQEKADTRADLVQTLAVGLGPDDEPFLEAALDDRASSVRAAVPPLLAHIATSAFAARARAHAEAILIFKDGALDAKPPTALEQAALRDGIVEKPQRGTGQRGWWLLQLLSTVAPSHWVAYFGMSPEALIAAISPAKWRSTLLEGWTRAAVAFADDAWIAPLWAYWQEPAPAKEEGDRDEMRTLLAPHVPSAALEQWALAVLADPAGERQPTLDSVLAALPSPWSAAIGRAYLAGLRTFVAALGSASDSAAPWDVTLDIAARALPPECFAAALDPFAMPENNHHWRVQQFGRQLDAFADVIRLRRRILEEIPV
jgi:hypothetical protein